MVGYLSQNSSDKTLASTADPDPEIREGARSSRPLDKGGGPVIQTLR